MYFKLIDYIKYTLYLQSKAFTLIKKQYIKVVYYNLTCSFPIKEQW